MYSIYFKHLFLCNILLKRNFFVNHSLYLDVNIGLQRVLFIIMLYPSCEINWFFKEHLRGSPPYFSKIERRMLNVFVKVSSAKQNITNVILMLMLSNSSPKSSSNWLFLLKLTWRIFTNPKIVSFEFILKHEIHSTVLVHWDMSLKIRCDWNF